MNRFIHIAVIAAVVFCISSCGYGLIKKNEQVVLKAWAEVETNLHRRADLIPDLIGFVNNYAPNESEILKDVINARAKTALIQFSAKDLSDSKAMAAFSEVQNDLSSVLSKLKNVVERYPNLKANQNFLEVWNRIEGTENRMAVSCRQYNKAVETFNQSIRKFPNNVTNKLFLQIGGKEQLKIQPQLK